MDKTNGKSCLIVSETYLPLFGGAELYTYNLAKQLAGRGYRITIMTYAHEPIPPAYEIPGVSLHVLPKFSKREWRKVPILLKELAKGIDSHDLLFVNYTYALAAATAILARLSRRTYTVFAHGFGTIIDRTHPWTYHVYRSISLRLAAHAITTSEEIADIVRRFTRSVLVATAVDFAAIDASIRNSTAGDIFQEPSKKIVLTIRRLVEKNGIQFLIEAIPYLRAIRDDFLYVAIGGGRLRPLLEARVRELGIEAHVQFLGEMENERVFSYIDQADVVVFPSSAEALSLAAIECMHLKTPIVVSAIGGLRELVGQQDERGTSVDLFHRTESVYEAPDPGTLSGEVYASFAAALNDALAGTDEITRKAAAAEEYVRERYDWPLVANTILAFAEEPDSGMIYCPA